MFNLLARAPLPADEAVVAEPRRCPCGLPLTLFYCLLPEPGRREYRVATTPPPPGTPLACKMWAASAADLRRYWNWPDDVRPTHAMVTEGDPPWHLWGACTPDLLTEAA